MASIFDNIEMGPPIEVFALNKAFLEDNSPDKVNLGVGGKHPLPINSRFVINQFSLSHKSQSKRNAGQIFKIG